MPILFYLAAILMLSSCNSDLNVMGSQPVEHSGQSEIFGLNRLQASAGDIVRVSGLNLTRGMIVQIDGENIPLTVSSSGSASFIMPQTDVEGSIGATFLTKDNQSLATLALVSSTAVNKIPVMDVDPGAVCSDLTYQDPEGHMKIGLRNCSAGLPLCSKDGQTACTTNETFPAVNMGSLMSQQQYIRAITTIAGVKGTLSDCSIDGDKGCVVTGPTFAAGLTIGASSKILQGSILAGVTGSAAPSNPCINDGQGNCLVDGISFSAMSLIGASTKISAGATVGGVAGTSPIRPTDCSADGQTTCVAMGPGYAAASVLGASSKILSGQTVAGITGTAPLRPTDCSVDGGISCVASSTFPAVDKALKLTANAAKFRDTVSIAGVVGTLADCSVDGDAGCVVMGPTYAALLKTVAPVKIVTGQSLAGVSGSAPARPSNCSTDGGTNCVAVALFPAAQASTSTAKIVLGQTVAGLTGTAPNVRPSDCSLDGELGCVATASFKSMQISGAAAKIAAGVTLGSVAGTAGARPLDCASDGDTGCVAVADFPAVDKINSLTGNISSLRTTASIAGVQGTLANCANDGETDCVAVGAFPAAKVAGSAVKIVSGLSVAGISGSASAESHSNCSGNAQTGCVSTSTFQSADIGNLSSSNVKSGVLIAGITGSAIIESHSSCASDGSTGCVAGSSYPAAKLSNFSAGDVKTGVTIAGVPGSATLESHLTCSGDNGIDCVTTTAFPSVVKSNVTAGVIKASTVIAGVTGNYPSSTYPLASNTSTTDLTMFTSQITSNSVFEFFDSAGSRYAASGDSDLKASNVRAGTELENISLVGVLNPALNAPIPLVSTYDSGLNQSTVTWANTGAAGYLLVMKLFSQVNFVPVNGVTYNSGAQGSETILYVGAGTSYIHSGLTAQNSYNYAVYSFDDNHLYAPIPARALNTSVFCSGLAGGTYVVVPGDMQYGTRDFCIMKFHAKNVSNAPVSQAALTPWTVTNQNSGSYCNAYGNHYNIPSNDEWMTMATNAAAQASNWSGGVVGTGVLNRGHTDNNPASPCPASSDDALAWVHGGSCVPLASGGDVFAQRRIHKLSNGEVIWDIGGNSFNWLNGAVTGTRKPYVASDGSPVDNPREMNAFDAGFGTISPSELIPRNFLKPFWNDSWASPEGIGMYLAGSTTGFTVLRRGAAWGEGDSGGIFYMNSNFGSAQSANYTSFRCVWRP
ncbi:MAG: hypothetical protein EOP04_05850 [Proteobacteria bacterium]|nr:MAG: hypothetical protein EOP04_05850 [Pseudomonadota bacterium]